MFTNGQAWLGGGTSSAAPWWGGVWATATELSLSLSGKPLGPAGPLIYHIANSTNCFRDVTAGSNRCPFGPKWEGQYCNCTDCHGFEASKGWDPVSRSQFVLCLHLSSAQKQLLSSVTKSSLAVYFGTKVS